jgi:hypothetical protein
MAWTPGTLAQPCTTAAATMSGSGTPKQLKSLTPQPGSHPPHLKMPVASKADLLVAGINDLTSILASNFQGTLEPLTDSDLNALAQTTFLLLQHADATPITSLDCAPVLRVPHRWHNKTKPGNQQEPRLPSPILCRSLWNHPLSHQANTVLEPNTGQVTAPPDRPYLAHVKTRYQFTPATLNHAPSSPKKVQFAEDIGRPASPTSVDDHPSYQLNDAAILLFLNGNLPEDVQQVAFKAINPDTGLLADYKVLSKSSDGTHWIEGNYHEFGRLAQGYKNTKDTDTIHFIPVSHLPADRKATYFCPICADRPNKAEPRRVRHTVGGNQLTTPTMSAPRLLVSSQQKSCSTALSAPLMPNV